MDEKRHIWLDGGNRRRRCIVFPAEDILTPRAPSHRDYFYRLPSDEISAREILRLAARVAELEVEVAAKEATIRMAVARLGGNVEGAPTHRINFLQRIDELREIERLREEDPLA